MGSVRSTGFAPPPGPSLLSSIGTQMAGADPVAPGICTDCRSASVALGYEVFGSSMPLRSKTAGKLSFTTFESSFNARLNSKPM